MAEEKKKKSIGRKLLPLWIILGLLVVIVGTPVVLVALAYDGRRNVTDYGETTAQEVGSKAFLRGLNNIDDDGVLDVAITKKDANGVIATVTKEFTNIDGPVENIYILTKGNKVTAYIEISAWKFKTRLSVESTIETTDDDFVMGINKFKLGNLSLNRETAVKVLGWFGVKLNDEKDFDLFVLDLKNWQIRLSKEVMFDSLKKGSDQNEFVKDVFTILENENLITFDTSTNNLIDMKVDLKKLQNNDKLTNDDDHLFINKPSSPYTTLGVDEIKAEIGGKLDKLVPYLPEDKLNTVFQYLFNGYEYCDEQTKSYIHNFSMNHQALLEEIGIPDVTLYTSYMDELNEDAGTILGNAKAQVSYAAIGSKKVCKLNEKDINKYLRSRGIIGYSDVVYHEDQNGQLDYAYFLIDNFYCNILDDSLVFVIGLNVNGFETNLVLTLKAAEMEASSQKTYFCVESAQFGEVETDALVEELFDILNSNVESDDVVGFTKIEDKTYFYFDLEPVTDKIKEFDDSIDETKVSLKANGENLTSEGYLSIEIAD